MITKKAQCEKTWADAVRKNQELHLFFKENPSGRIEKMQKVITTEIKDPYLPALFLF